MKVAIEGLTVDYGQQVAAVRDLDLTVEDGELMVVVGPSGCGKTTTLGFVSGFIKPRSGRVLFDGADVTDLPPQRRSIGYVFQDYAIYPHMTVHENIRFPLDAARVPRRDADRDVARAAELMRVDKLLARRPHQLSGGQRQRVALARAIVKRPSVLLLDEPLSNLDAHVRVDVRAEIRRLQLELHMTTVFVTHDQAEALAVADRVAVMSEGRIVALATPGSLYAKPPSLFAASFIGSPRINVWSTSGPDADLARRLGAEMLPSGPPGILVAARPEHIVIGSGPVTARVTLTEPLGRDHLVHLDVGETSIRVLAPADQGERLSPGVDVAIHVAPGRLHLFDPVSGLRLGPDDGPEDGAAASREAASVPVMPAPEDPGIVGSSARAMSR
jgi:ABC-type sugar transport system ATPase subunit